MTTHDDAATRDADAAAGRAEYEMHGLLALTDVALSRLPLEALLPALLERVLAVMRVDHAAILLLDDEQTLCIRAARGLGADSAGSVCVPIGQGFAGRIAASRKALVVGDLATVEVVHSLLRERLRSAAGVPLLAEGRVLGVLYVASATPRTFTAADLDLLERAADRVALAVDRAQLLEQAQVARDEAAARASQLEAMFETMTDGVAIYDAEGRLTRMNAALRGMLGVTEGDREYAAVPLEERMRPFRSRDEQGHLRQQGERPRVQLRVLRGEVLTGANTEDVVFTTRDGHEIFVNIAGAPVRDAEDRIAGAVLVVRDMTERRRLERRTHDALEALLAMAEALVQPRIPAGDAAEKPGRAGIDDLDPAAQELAELAVRALGSEYISIVALTPGAETAFPIAIAGLTPEQMREWWARWVHGVTVRTLVDEEQLARLRAGESLPLELRSPTYRGDAYGVRTTLVVPMRIGEQMVGAMAIGYATAGRSFTGDELALAGTVGKLVALVVQRERLLREREEARALALALEETNRRMDEFLGVAGHEMRTPLTVIKANLQLQSKRMGRDPIPGGVTDEAHAPLVDRSLRQVERLIRLVSDMLDISRIRAGKLDLRPEPCDLAQLTREVVEEQRQLNPTRRIVLREPDGPVPLVADSDRIAQVLTNFIVNALKYSKEHQPVEVWLEAAGNAVRLYVRDRGPGIPESELGQIWEPFHRVPGVTVQSGSGIGLGLGLFISKTIVERHGGSVGVASAPGKGSTLSLTLPRA